MSAGLHGPHRMGEIGRVHSAPPAVRRCEPPYPTSPPPAYEEVLKQPRQPPPSYNEAERSRRGPGRGGRGLSRSQAQDIPDIYWEQAARELDFCTCRKCQVQSDLAPVLRASVDCPFISWWQSASTNESPAGEVQTILRERGHSVTRLRRLHGRGHHSHGDPGNNIKYSVKIFINCTGPKLLKN